MSMPFYQFTATNIRGEQIGMDAYRGKTILVVNTASKCGFTPQYEGLEALYRKYKDEGFVVLAFPCNQFGNQEPGDEASIFQGCLLNYGVSFPVFAKVDVNGKNTDPIFSYLKKELNGFLVGGIKWNFTKFLIDANGKPVKRFGPTVTQGAIDRYLANKVFAPPGN